VDPPDRSAKPAGEHVKLEVGRDLMPRAKRPFVVDFEKIKI
jgi:hypothetical protein